MQKLRQAQRRLILGQTLRWTAPALALGLSALFVFVLGAAWFAWSPVGALGAATFILLPCVVVFVAALGRWNSLPVVARELDRQACTRDRFATVLQLGQEEPGPFVSLAGEECARYASQLRVRDAVGVRVRAASFLWVLLPVAGLAVLSLVDLSRRAAVAPELARATKVLEAARQAAAQQPKPDAAVLKEIDQALEQVKNSSEPWKEALGALADLEDRLASGQGKAGGLTPGEAAALASAVAQQNPQLAAMLRSGQQADAAQKISSMAPEDVKKALEDAARHLDQQRLRDLANQSAPEAQRSLARIMRSSSDPSAGDGSGQRRLASAIQDAKNDSLGDGSSQSEQGKGNPTDAPNGKNPSNPGDSVDSRPGGAAGSDKDKGQGSDLAGQQDPRSAPTAQDETFGGQEADGASIVDTYRSAGNDNAEAQRAYRAAYQKAAAAALDSVSQEEIPAGSRLMVKRYFESIRPTE